MTDRIDDPNVKIAEKTGYRSFWELYENESVIEKEEKGLNE